MRQLVSRRWLQGAALAAALVASTGVAAQNPAPAAQAPAPDPLTFNVDRMLVVFQIAEAQATDFEVTMGRVKEVLAKSDKPERRQQAAHWKLLKVSEPQNGVLTYFFLLDEVAKGVSYDPFKILGEGLPADEVGALYAKVNPGIKAVSAAPLGFIVNMSLAGGVQ